MDGGELLVLPQLFDIAPLRLSSGEMGTEAMARASEDVTNPTDVRTYQPGDPMKKIHWKLSARKQEALVRRFEDPVQPDALVLKHIHLSPIVCTWSVALRLPHVISHVALEFPHRSPPSLQSPMHTGGIRRSRMQDGRRSDLTLTAQARRPICDANIPSQEELRLLVQPGTCTPILPNAQENRAFVRLRTTI